MNKVTLNKFVYIFGVEKINEISYSSIERVFKDLASPDDILNKETCHQQIVDLWEAKHGPIVLL